MRPTEHGCGVSAFNPLRDTHYPLSLPVLRDRGEPTEQPTSGDVEAVTTGCKRLLAGESLTARGRDGVAVSAYLTPRNGVLRIGAVVQYASNAYDLAVLFYGACWSWQNAWHALEGGAL